MDDADLKELLNDLRHLDEPNFSLLVVSTVQSRSPVNTEKHGQSGSAEKKETRDSEGSPLEQPPRKFSATAEAAGDRYPWIRCPDDKKA